MSWSPLATQFCLQLSFGVLLAMAFVPRAPVGVLFYRIMGTTALAPLLVAILAPPLAEAEPWWTPPALCASVAVLAFPVYSGPVRGLRWGAALGLAILACAAGVLLPLRASLLDPGVVLLGSLTALATGAVAGSVALAMVLGHWYLTVPNLNVSHLKRLNRVSVGSMLACLFCLALSCGLLRGHMDPEARALLGPTGLFYLGTRAAVGLALPLLFAGMTASSLRYQNTRSATGILYASTVLVLIGAAVSVFLQGAYGVPL